MKQGIAGRLHKALKEQSRKMGSEVETSRSGISVRLYEMIVPLLQGLKLTLQYFFSKKVTLQYPDEKWDVAPRWRGRHVLTKHASGKIRCVACMLCATVCPAECISIVAAAEPDNRKYPESYELDLGRCIFCGYCVEVCPKEAIEMTTAYELSEYSREDLIFTKEMLLEPPEPRYVSKKKAG